jgi:dienelactone hydrolase
MIGGRTLRRLVSAVTLALGLAACGAGGHAAPVRPIVPSTATIPPGRRGITGASQARCTPGPCSALDPPVSHTLSGVANGDGTTSTRAYAVVRPHGLVASSTNRAPAVLVFYAGDNCGFEHPGRWSQLAVVHRFIVVALEAQCSVKNWRKRNILSPRPVKVSDEPYVNAVVRAIERCPGECVDPRRVYAVGESSGGSMVADVMCDAENSSLFRGFFIDDSSLPLYQGVPDCPTTNVGFFVMMALSNYSIDRGLYDNTASRPHLTVPAFAAWAAHRLRCTSSVVPGALGTARTYSYDAPCAFATGGTAVMTLGVINGGHGWGCQDSDPSAVRDGCPGMPVPPGLGPNGRPKTGGLFIEGAFWRLVSRGSS